MLEIILRPIVISGFEAPSYKNEWRFLPGDGGNINGSSISFPTARSIARTTSSIPHAFKKCFFEIHVAKGLIDEENGYIAIGLTTKDTKLPGLDQNTAAYISFDGEGSIDQDGEELKEVEGISQGDTIRCNLEFIRICDQTITCFTFCNNGNVISTRRYINAKNIYPTIKVRGEGLEVETIFGTMEDTFPQGI